MEPTFALGVGFDIIRAAIGACDICKDIYKMKAQPCAGKFPVLFVGQAPSKIGCVKNDIFRGTAVPLMHKYKGLVYETNAICCHSHPPEQKHRKACSPWLQSLILNIPAKAVFTFGVVAHQAVVALDLPDEIKTHKFTHPCYIVRWYKNNGYKWSEFVASIDEALSHYTTHSQ